MTGLDWLARCHGFLLVDKPEGITSQDAITRLQRALIDRSGGALRKRDLPTMGHGGTLDPFATGLLVVAVGDGAKLTRYLLGSDKSYVAEIAFGARTASGDRTNEVVERTDRLPRDLEALRRAAASFLAGPYLQKPPMYSAKKIDGTRLYELARKGLDVEREPVRCAVRELAILPDGATIGPSGVAGARLRATVSSGTFVRTLAEDLAARVESLGHLVSLRRTASGSLRLDEAVPLATIETAIAEGRAIPDLPAFIPFHRAVEGILPRLEIAEATAERIFRGDVRALAELPLAAPGSTALYSGDRLVAIVREATPAEGLPRAIERGFPLRFGDPL